jgi:hypothetical protein
LSTQGHHHTRKTLFKAFKTYIAAIILESSASLALPPAAAGRRIRLESPGSRGAPKAPIYFGRDGRTAGDAIASNFGRSPDSALTTCSRSRRNSRIRDTKSSTLGTDGAFGPGARLDGGQLFCAMKYFQNQSDDNAPGRDQKMAGRLWDAGKDPARTASHQSKQQTQPVAGSIRILSRLRCTRNFLNGM